MNGHNGPEASRGARSSIRMSTMCRLSAAGCGVKSTAKDSAMAQIDHAGAPHGSALRRRLVKLAETEFEPPTEVKRPWLAGLLATVTATMAFMAVLGLSGLSSSLLQRPVTLASE